MNSVIRKIAVVPALVFACTVSLWSQAPVPVSPAIVQRVDKMVAGMSLDDKLTLIGGEDAFFIPAIPSIGLKRMKMSDGPVGVRTFGPTTAYTAGVALAASWDTDLAGQVGAALGADARARGVNYLLAPGVNIYRSPVNGRNMEYFGEDPYLAGRIAVGYIQGVQSKGVSATVKHFDANNSEFDRHNINAVIDERTLRELYLPAFEAAVKQGHVGAVMDSYNLVNGEHSTQNGHLNVDILRKDWGFQGVLMSDWDATYDGVAAANKGLDLEMPYAKLMTPATLKAALKDGRVKIETIDEKVRHILITAARFGWLDRDQTDASIPLYNLASDHTALEEARHSITLLKNEGNLLPLDSAKTKVLAIVGPEAAAAVPGGGGSSHATPFEAQSFVAAFASYLGNRTKVMYVPGIPAVRDLAGHTTFQNMTLETRSGSRDAASVVTHDVKQINRWPRDGRVTGAETKTTTYYRWKGQFLPSTTGEYVVAGDSGDGDEFHLSIDGHEVMAHKPSRGSRLSNEGVVTLTAQHPATVEFEYETRSAEPHITLAIAAESELLSQASKDILKTADAALVTVGFDATTESEGFDRSYTMPGMQNQLVSAVAALCPRTIVAVTAGGAVETKPWLAAVPSLLHNYYPGQEGARALAEIVFGERSPEGHLPFTWDRTLADNPTSGSYYEENGGRDSHYTEGLNVGYRYYTSMKKQPLFPFGFGLSYTKFSFAHPVVKRLSGEDVEVAFDVRNTGTREGATVAQVYVSDPSAKVKRPVIELKQFAKVHLRPGAEQHVVLHLDRRAFEYYDVEGKGWKLDPGAFTIFVGQSSEALDLRQNLDMF
ncbi:MAG TPA: glycoside hydrolase family 3 C-terminal domain-containing protein [Acidobacteriaceae bacterium]|jgi:beta-glucosidase